MRGLPAPSSSSDDTRPSPANPRPRPAWSGRTRPRYRTLPAAAPREGRAAGARSIAPCIDPQASLTTSSMVSISSGTQAGRERRHIRVPLPPLDDGHTAPGGSAEGNTKGIGVCTLESIATPPRTARKMHRSLLCATGIGGIEGTVRDLQRSRPDAAIRLTEPAGRHERAPQGERAIRRRSATRPRSQ